MDDLTIIAVDWSGRRGIDQMHYIRAAVINSSGEMTVWFDHTRDDVIEGLLDLPGPLVVGFDFSFGLPAWVGRCHGVTNGTALWPIVESHADEWLATCPPPFFGHKGTFRPVGVELLRDTEREHPPAKPTLLINGPGAVGTGSLRGMPLLTRLRMNGFAVWPFDDPNDRTVVEIYPSSLRQHADVTRLTPAIARAVRRSDDTRDAVLSALVMWEQRASFSALRATDDPRTMLEGTVWTPFSC